MHFVSTYKRTDRDHLTWALKHDISKLLTSRFGSAIEVLPSDTGEYFSSFSIAVLFLFSNWKMYFFNTVNSCVRKKVYLLTYSNQAMKW